MSGTTPPGLGLIVKLVIVLLALMGLAYIGVVMKLISDPNLNLTWEIIFGLITPLLIILFFIISHLSEDKSVNFVIVFFLSFINLLYLLIPVNTYFTKWIYHGESMMITTLLIGLFSILTTFLILFGLAISIFFIIKFLERNEY
jgi:hypothetical protein